MAITDIFMRDKNKDKDKVIVIDDIMIEEEDGDSISIDSVTTTKKQKLINLFDGVGIKHSQGYVLEETGIKNQTTLKSMLTRLRKKGINIKMKFGFLIRLE